MVGPHEASTRTSWYFAAQFGQSNTVACELDMRLLCYFADWFWRGSAPVSASLSTLDKEIFENERALTAVKRPPAQ